MWEPGFSHCWNENLRDKQKNEAKMIHVIMDKSWRHHYELMFLNAAMSGYIKEYL